MAMAPLSIKLPAEQAEHLAVLATKLGVSEGELVRQFVTAGLVLNPVSDTDRAAHVAKQRARGAGEVLGLVVPLDPLRSRRDPDPPPKRGGRRPLARVLPLTARIPGGRKELIQTMAMCMRLELEGDSAHSVDGAGQ